MIRQPAPKGRPDHLVMLSLNSDAAFLCMQLWCHAVQLLAEVLLEVISRIKGRCSAIGRNAIASDVQATS